MENYIASLEKEISLIENGFKEEEKRALSDYRSNDKEFVKKLAFSAYNSNTYQVRMYGVFLFGYLSEQNDILTFMRDEVSKDDNWRVQEVLAKAFDEFCKNTGYEKALPIIDEWLENDNPNTRRAVTEGLRILQSPAAGINTIQNILNLTKLLNPMNYIDELEYGRYKGHSTAYKAFFDSPVIPFNKTIYRGLHPEEAMLFFKQQ